MSDTLITIIAIVVAAGLMFVFPLMAISNSQDDIAQVSVQALVSDFVNTAATQGKITKEAYDDFTSKLYATGNSYEIEIEHKIMTTNPNKGGTYQLGENNYYSVFNETIIDGPNGVDTTGEYLMKKGDYIVVNVKNTNTTIATQIKDWLYSIGGNDTYVIAASASASVVNTGSSSK